MTGESLQIQEQQTSYSVADPNEVHPLPPKDSPDYTEAVRCAAAEPKFTGTMSEYIAQRRVTREAMYRLALQQNIPGL